MIRSILYTISALLLLSGCTKELTEPGSRNDGKMRISFSTPVITDDTATPPPATGRETTQSSPRTSITENTTIRVVVYLAGGMTYVADQTYYMNGGKLKTCTVNADGTFKEVDMQNELALIPDKYDFYAITPALPLNADQKTVTVPNGVDYASSVTSDKTVNSDQTLELTQLSRKSAKIALEVKKADDNTAMTSLQLNPSGKGVTISALPASKSITLNADIAPATGTTTLTIPASVFTLNGTTSTATTYLLPRLGTSRLSLSYDLTYTVSNTPESKTVSGSMGNTVLKKGKSYTFTLTMRKTGASLTVVDWIESNQEVVTGQSIDYSKTGNPWFFIAAADAKNPDPNAAEPFLMDWYKATGTAHSTYNPDGKYKACPDGWRVPTHEELMLMWVVKEAIPRECSPTANDYWSSTEYDATNSWITRFTNGYTFANTEVGTTKVTNLKVRCIRDIGLNERKTPSVMIATDNKIIIDNRDMLDGAISTKSKARDTKATNTTSVPVDDDTDIASKKSNSTISHYFEVAKKDCKETAVNWITAINDCKTWTEDGGNWRLPTQREVILMYALSKNINQQASSIGFIPFGVNNYWSATESLESYSWGGNLNYGFVSYWGTLDGNKSFNYYVRCVRDAGLSVASSTVTADYAQWGNSFSKSVAFSSVNGSVTVKSIDNSSTDKNWLVSAVVSGSTSGQVQITYKPTPGNAGVHNDVTITLVNQAGTTQTITVKYDNGFIPSSILSANGWTTSLPINGVQIAKKGNKLPSGTADANWDNELMQWASIAGTNVPAAQEQGYGKGVTNTTAIITALGVNAVAANKCRASLGSEWYLFSQNELHTLQKTKTYLGTSYLLVDNNYWSSTENSSDVTMALRVEMMSGINNTPSTKNYSSYVRCVRNVQ